LSDRIVAAQKGIRILDAIKWDDSIRADFFAHGCNRQPAVDLSYYESIPLDFDPAATCQTFAAIDRDISGELGTFNPAGQIMQRMCREYLLVIDMLAARGTADFSRISQQLYGRATDAFHSGQPSLVDLAELLQDALRSIDERMFLEQAVADVPSEQAVIMLQQRLDESFGAGEDRVHVRASDGIVADAAAGSDYIKLRQGALFSERDIRVLEVHEGWVHVGTTLNGRAQPVCSFLEKGTPSTTITQEGLALLIEIISFSSHPSRLRRVTDRIHAIDLATRGASFIEVFEYLQQLGRSADDAYTTAMRAFRGSTPELGPFTKDLSYSKGFVLCYNFIQLAVRRGRLERIPLLFCGKLTLGEMGMLAALADEGLVEPPRFLPPPIRDLNGLTALMAYSNFLNRIDLAKVETDFGSLLA